MAIIDEHPKPYESSRYWRKKPVVIEAVRFKDGNHLEVIEWVDGRCDCTAQGEFLMIGTPAGTMKARDGDWIVRGVHGEFYASKPKIFADTYERAFGPHD